MDYTKYAVELGEAEETATVALQRGKRSIAIVALEDDRASDVAFMCYDAMCGMGYATAAIYDAFLEVLQETEAG